MKKLFIIIAFMMLSLSVLYSQHIVLPSSPAAAIAEVDTIHEKTSGYGTSFPDGISVSTKMVANDSARVEKTLKVNGESTFNSTLIVNSTLGINAPVAYFPLSIHSTNPILYLTDTDINKNVTSSPSQALDSASVIISACGTGPYVSIGGFGLFATPVDQLAPQLLLLGDSDLDASEVTSSYVSLTLTPTNDPNNATWNFTNDGSGGYSFDEKVTTPTLVASDSERVEKTLLVKGAATFNSDVNVASTKYVGVSGGQRVEFEASAIDLVGTPKINNTWTLPTTAGTNSYVLTTNGSDAATWTSVGALTFTPSAQNTISGQLAGFYFDGTNDNIQIADNVNLDFGTDDFAIEIVGFRPGNVTQTGKSIYSHCGVSGDTLIISQATTGLTFTLDDGTTRLASQSLGTGILTANQNYHIFINFDRDGNCTAYVNGAATGTTVDISTVNLSVSPDASVSIGGSAGAYWTGAIKKVRIWNMCPTVAEIGCLANGQDVPYKYVGADQVVDYTADWSAGVDGWQNNAGTVVSGNVDGVSDGTTSKDNCLKFYADGSSGFHGVSKEPGLTILNKAIVSVYWAYIPAAQTHTDGFYIFHDGWSTTDYSGQNGTWTLNRDIFTSNEGIRSDVIIIRQKDGSATTFTGANDSGDDIMYLASFTKYYIGCIGEWNFSEASTTTAYDRSGNGNHGTVNGATLFNENKTLYARKAVVPDSIQFGSGAWVRKMFVSVTGDSLGTIFYNTVASKLDTAWAVTK